MRVLILVALFCLSAADSFCYTFILKSGKKIDGVLLYEESTTIRIEDNTGVPMTLKKSSLDWDRMAQANPPEPPPQFEPVVVAHPSDPPKHSVRVFRNTPGSTIQPVSAPRSEKEWKDRIRSAEKTFYRLKDACRNAGTGPDLKTRLETHVYTVNGKKVTVTGYWAHPDSVRAANQICQKAIRAEMELAVARQGFSDFQETPGSTSGMTGGMAERH